MKRLLLTALLVLGCTPAAATSTTTYAPLTSGFVALSPSVGAGEERHPAGTPDPSVLPSTPPAPTTVILPPAISVKGVAGVATWYAYHRGQAAAAARLRAYLGPNWRGSTVTVCGPHAYLPCISIVLTDYESSKIPGRLIDLDVGDFATLCGDPGRGVCAVTVSGR